MPTNLLILETPKNNKAEAPSVLFISLNMIFMPFYLKIHLIFITLLTHVMVRLQQLNLDGFLPQMLSFPCGKAAQVSGGRWV